MMPWIAISREIANDPKVHALAEATKLDVDACIGKLVRLFAAMAEHAPDGRLDHVPATTLEVWANWRGKRGLFAGAFLAGFAPDGKVTAWERYNGAKIKKAERDRERLRAEYSRDSRGILARENGESRDSLAGNKDIDTDNRSRSKAPLTQQATNTHAPDALAAPASNGKHEPAGFAAAWAALPRRDGSNPRNRAAHAYAARLKDGIAAEAMYAGAVRYAAYCDAKGMTGSVYVMQGVRFFGAGCEFLEPWRVEEPTIDLTPDPRLNPVHGWMSPELEAATRP
jgi:hypothetical protein